MDGCSWVIHAQGLPQGDNHDVTWGCSHMKARPGLEGLFPHWLKASVPHQGDFSMGLLVRPCDGAAGFPQHEWPERDSRGWKLQCLS